jgi:hypothetical protein
MTRLCIQTSCFVSYISLNAYNSQKITEEEYDIQVTLFLPSHSLESKRALVARSREGQGGGVLSEVSTVRAAKELYLLLRIFGLALR